MIPCDNATMIVFEFAGAVLVFAIGVPVMGSKLKPAVDAVEALR